MNGLADLIPEGRENAVSADYLSRIMGTSRRQLRKLIERARKSGTLICSWERGYFFPRDKAELQQYILTVNRRILTEAECLAPFITAAEEGETGQ